MSKVLHPKCGKRFANAASVGHCSVCCETFVGQGAFDKHFTRNADGSYTHREPVENINIWWLDERGYWHYGPRMTEEQKQERFPKAEEA